MRRNAGGRVVRGHDHHVILNGFSFLSLLYYFCDKSNRCMHLTLTFICNGLCNVDVGRIRVQALKLLSRFQFN